MEGQIMNNSEQVNAAEAKAEDAEATNTGALERGAGLPAHHRRWLEKRGSSLLPASWRVELPVFQGPLDLLLHLIRINEVEIVDIPVALICDQYHEYLGLMEDLDLDIAGEYIYEAAVLIQLKSRMLLPKQRDEEGQLLEDDPRDDLVRRLLEYRRLKEAAQTLAEVDSVRGGLWTREKVEIEPDPEEQGKVDLDQVSLFDLLKALNTVLERYDSEHPDPLVFQGEVFSVRDQIDYLLNRLNPGRPLDLVDELLGMSGRSEAIATFLAVLELARLNLVRLHQTASREILLYRTTREAVSHELETIAG